MKTGDTLAFKGLMNPQISYGEDVVSRISAANKSAENAEKLQSLLVEALNQTASRLCFEAGAMPSDIVEAWIVGNAAIHYLFLRLPVRQLGPSPYVPAVRSAVDRKARDSEQKFAPGCYVHLLLNIAGYVGADHAAMLLAIEMARSSGTLLAIDVGRNTKIRLNHCGRLTSVSCSSGPAFGGAHIRFGMRERIAAIHWEHSSGRGETRISSGHACILLASGGCTGWNKLEFLTGKRVSLVFSTAEPSWQSGIHGFDPRQLHQ
jgi:uncharacterized 2Fe-2S/4Fe-4S cluster protein (DUF4445 family)